MKITRPGFATITIHHGGRWPKDIVFTVDEIDMHYQPTIQIINADEDMPLYQVAVPPEYITIKARHYHPKTRAQRGK